MDPDTNYFNSEYKADEIRRTRFFANWQELLGAILLLFIVLCFLISHFFSPYEAGRFDASSRFLAPSREHLFGTDNYGRDIFTRAFSAGGISLLIASGTILIGSLGGLILGGLAGYFGGILDWFLMRFNDALMSFPSMLLALLFVAVLGGGVPQLMLAMGILFVPSFARVVRSGFRQAKGKDYVKRLVIMGAKPSRIMFRHILPGMSGQMVSAMTIGFANAILTETSLSYLGLGIPPTRASWGRMLFEAQAYLFSAPWYAVFPGLLIVLTVLSAFFLGTGLRLRAGEVD